MFKRGKIGNRDYLVIGMRKDTANDCFSLKFVKEDPKNKNGKIVGKLTIPIEQAKILGKFFLGKKIKKEPL